MNGGVLLLPFLAVRFGLLLLVDKKAIGRAGHFAPVRREEQWASFIYQLSNIGLFAYLFFLTIRIDFSLQFYMGLVFYFSGIVLCAVSAVCFALPDESGLNINGIYQLSRNPMYVAYFICFAGMAFLTQSCLLLGIVLIFQVSAPWIILSEERECTARFGRRYEEYKQKVRRYI